MQKNNKIPGEVSRKVRIRFEPMGSPKMVPVGTKIAEAATDLCIPLRLDCGGQGLCAKCRVIAQPASNLSPLTESELDVFSPSEIRQSYRLACQATAEGNVTITLPSQAVDSSEAKDKTLLQDTFPVDPEVERIELPAAELPTRAAGSDLAGWVMERARSVTSKSIRMDDLDGLRQLSDVGSGGEAVTLVHHGQRGVTSVIAGSRKRSLGVAIDVGTTTLAAYLCDLGTGKLEATAASVNPQRRYGEDVISRIAFADEHVNGLHILHTLIIEAVNHLIGRCLEQAGAGHEEVDEVIIVGNTTMERILIGFHPRGLGMSPYLPVFRAAQNLKARDLGLKMNPGTNIFVFPVVSGFVGGDTVSAVIADAMDQRVEKCLLVDIGTNGELALGNRNELWTTSCATGPALEGAQISCGMRAVSGAIHKVDINPDNFQPEYEVIGENHDILPVGVCGSGIIDAIAAMRKTGILMPNGRIQGGFPGVISDHRGIAREFVLVPAEKSGTRQDISIKLADVRQFQLAKSALSVGIELLMRHAGVDRVDRTVLTGSFGAKFDWKNALAIGMLPESAFGGEVYSSVNLAGAGAILALLDKKRREQATILAQKARAVDLAMDSEFAQRFAQGTSFPPLETS